MGSICKGLSLRGPYRTASTKANSRPVEAIADQLRAKPERLALLMRIAEIRGKCERSIENEPELGSLVSQQLVRFYSSFRGRTPSFQVYVLAKGDLVLNEIARRARKAELSNSYVRLCVDSLDETLAEMDRMAA